MSKELGLSSKEFNKASKNGDYINVDNENVSNNDNKCKQCFTSIQNFVDTIPRLDRSIFEMVFPEFVLNIMKPFSPPEAPFMWMFINICCMIGSGLMFYLAILPKKSYGHALIKTTYMPFELGICLIWTAEVILYMLFDEEHVADNKKPYPWMDHMEFFFAGFCILESFYYSFIYGGNEEATRSEILFWAGLDVVIYAYYLVHSVLHMKKESKKAKIILDDLNASTSSGNNNPKSTEMSKMGSSKNTSTKDIESASGFMLMK